MDPIRLGCVKFLNTLPMIEGLATCSDLTLVSAVPAKLIDLLLTDQVDIAICSLIDAASSPTPLRLIPCGMIGCDGPTLTVRLFSAVPLEQIHAVHADTDSHTSVALVQVLLHRLYGVRPEIIPFDARERVALRPESRGGSHASSNTGVGGDWPESLLMIGDKVVSDSPPAVRYPHQLDLGEAWKRMTGLPFVYAAWMCKAERAGETDIQHGAALLDRQLRHNGTRLDWLVGARAADRSWPDDLARTYVGELLRYRVDDRAREAADRFIEEAAALGLCPAAKLRWVDEFETDASSMTGVGAE